MESLYFSNSQFGGQPGNPSKTAELKQQKQTLDNKTHGQISEADLVSYKEIANKFFMNKDFNEASEIYQKLITEYEKINKYHVQLGGICSNMGQAYFAISDYHQSIKTFEKAVEVKTHNNAGSKEFRKAYQFLGQAHAGIQQYQTAIEYFQKHIEILEQMQQNEKDEYIIKKRYFQLASYYMLNKDNKNAIEIYRRESFKLFALGQKLNFDESANLTVGCSDFLTKMGYYNDASDRLNEIILYQCQTGTQLQSEFFYKTTVKAFRLQDFNEDVSNFGILEKTVFPKFMEYINSLPDSPKKQKRKDKAYLLYAILSTHLGSQYDEDVVNNLAKCTHMEARLFELYYFNKYNPSKACELIENYFPEDTAELVVQLLNTQAYDKIFRIFPIKQAYYEKAQSRISFYEESLKYLDQAIQLDPFYYEALDKKLMILESMQKKEEYIELAQKILDTRNSVQENNYCFNLQTQFNQIHSQVFEKEFNKATKNLPEPFKGKRRKLLQEKFFVLHDLPKDNPIFHSNNYFIRLEAQLEQVKSGEYKFDQNKVLMANYSVDLQSQLTEKQQERLEESNKKDEMKEIQRKGQTQLESHSASVPGVLTDNNPINNQAVSESGCKCLIF